MHTILKVKFLSKNSILTKNKHFHEIFTQNFFWQFFSWNQSCQQLKSPKPQHFHEFFTPKKIDNFLGKSKLNFWTKNEDFEQCVLFYFQDYLLIFQFRKSHCSLKHLLQYNLCILPLACLHNAQNSSLFKFCNSSVFSLLSFPLSFAFYNGFKGSSLGKKFCFWATPN